ncbi:MAG: 1,4-alpha-glucan-branching enzyme, partial [Bacteroidales bacterium]|nr:1,4-alpha-glucan-branching enzyme [Bacteroidales bacterium]
MIYTSDPYLAPHKYAIEARKRRVLSVKKLIAGENATLSSAINNHLYFCLHMENGEWVFREWAPNASAIYLTGDFNGWSRSEEFKLHPVGDGNWELRLPQDIVKHGDLYKWIVEWPGGSGERIPAYATRCVQDNETKLFSAQVWAPSKPYVWKHRRHVAIKNPFIYETHIGMSSEEPKVSTFKEFRENVLPRVVSLGYNTIQIMALQEHPYYGSFGYQVSNFFALSSRFGTPEEFKQLVDEAHKNGVAVIMDIVHSHAVRNELEGLSCLDGTYTTYFHGGPRGEHPAWNSRCFDYGKGHTLHFLLSNCKYWMEEYHLDGFRFDGVTSMLYYNHGLGIDFNGYDCYFNPGVDEDAVTYLGLANILIKELYPKSITIAEDMSGMAGLAAPIYAGGLGFDFRMSMGVPDHWIKWIKEKTDWEWSMGEIWYELTNKRDDEKTISYAECHDQALVGDKTIIFRLIDKEMYTSMAKSAASLVVDRGIALHKMIRLVTLATAGNGYLNFMGNEFGHPEWIDFPREGNDWSYFYARRQWSLADNGLLRYG